eukprot:CAMPEP_0174262936 /NCGR_PEP_ID=MMETSP0439-20130205/16277_1 /TAXON_ID=0 /ORGANISM="Stereomyxa ramosa, Strain Chinc5" /LENGTH=235 /DNA_ID=CAMNT_0015347995 /DNA_START=45 /DNA_END=749 /DNA_ORIENTATION=-
MKRKQEQQAQKKPGTQKERKLDKNEEEEEKDKENKVAEVEKENEQKAESKNEEENNKEEEEEEEKRSKNEEEEQQALSPSDWVKEAKRRYGMSLRDLMDLPIGEAVDLFLMDRNVFDGSTDRDPGTYLPSVFFADNYLVRFTKTDEAGLKGTWEWLGMMVGEVEEDRGFDVDLGRCWYPLEDDGKVPEEDQQGIFQFGEHAGKHFSELPDSTLVGWRGPMMLMEKMDLLPLVKLR